MTFLDLYREKYELRGGTAARFVEAYVQANPEAVWTTCWRIGRRA